MNLDAAACPCYHFLVVECPRTQYIHTITSTTVHTTVHISRTIIYHTSTTGTSGGWRKVLSQAQQDKFEAWISQHCADQEIMKNILHP